MIEHGHVHKLVPISRHEQPNGQHQIQLRCQGSPGLDPTGGCTLEEQMVVEGDRVIGIRYRFGGVWISALDLLRMADGIAVEECPDCHGTEKILTCETCLGVGVVEDGKPVGLPNLRV